MLASTRCGMKSRVSCLCDSAIIGFLEHGVSSEERAEIERHLDGCASCRQVVVDLTIMHAVSPTTADNQTTSPARLADRGQSLAPGAAVGRFVVLGLIGTGGMGAVYTAYDPELDRNIALKLLHPEVCTAEHARARIRAEAQAMARINHPGVVAIYEVGMYRDRMFAAMELVEGTTLRAWIAEGRRSWRGVIAVFLLAGEGLAAAHAAGIVHRDFKPENVLVGRDGRVKVTDFGLSNRSPTSDGGVAGTPGYLPVEALRGDAVDYRGDQFSFCVTLYEALHGHRPFSAQTPDDLASEVRRGPIVDRRRRRVPSRLSQLVRRGLALAPEDRHASMRELLDELRCTTSRRASLWAAVVAIAVALGASAVLAVERTSEPATALHSSLCERSPEAEMESAWSSTLRASLTQRFAGSPDLGYPAGELDGFAARWIGDYRSACASPRLTRTFARLACLLGERDEVARFADLIATMPASDLRKVDMGGVLPLVRACDGESPVSPPALPTDPVKRARIRELREKLLQARFAPIDQAIAEMPGLLAQAEALGWDPILAEAHEGFGLAQDRADAGWDLVRDHYKRASELALRSHHYRLESNLWIERLFSELQAASEPADPGDFERLVEQARDAVHNAGDDPVQLARMKWVEARSQQAAGRLDQALASARTAHAIALSARDFLTAMAIASDTVITLAMRNLPGDLDAAHAVLLDTQRTAIAAGFAEVRLRPLMWSFRLIALLRGDLASAHEWDDREPRPKPVDAAAATRGRVVDLHGNAVAGATVVAWSGVLEGDATRAYRRAPRVLGPFRYAAPRTYQDAGLDADVATTDSSGGFTIRSVRDGGIIAELGNQRSQPRAVGDGAIVLRLEPTRTIDGRVAPDDQVLSGVAITARYQLGDTLAWDCTAAVGRAHDYHLAGLPAGRATLRLDDWFHRPRKLELGTVRDGAILQWPAGPALDVIVHGGNRRISWVYVLRGRVTGKTAADLDRLVDRSAEATVNPAFVIGVADRTAEGMKYYQRDDRHRVTLGNAPGEVTACVTDADPTSPAICRTIEVPKTPALVRDGHRSYPAIPVVFQR